MSHRYVTDATSQKAWLLLSIELPARPTATRVHAWRQLKRIGALAVRNGLYALPDTPQAREDFEWLIADVSAARGDAALFTATPVAQEMTERLIRGFREARSRDYIELRRDAEQARRRFKKSSSARLVRTRSRLARAFAERLTRLEAIDFFGSDERAAAHQAVDALHHIEEDAMAHTTAHGSAGALRPSAFRRRVWVTRPRPGIDRFASAWLIRRFIDPDARFQFADSIERAGERHKEAIPFDMFGAEFGHHDRQCTFETLVTRFDLRDPKLTTLGRIVHVLDLKDDEPLPFEAESIGRLVDGFRQIHEDDDVLLERGIEMIEALYRSSGSPQPTKPAVRRRASRAAHRRSS
jgi:hypothetical protein